jgi:hypothetical protein
MKEREEFNFRINLSDSKMSSVEKKFLCQKLNSRLTIFCIRIKIWHYKMISLSISWPDFKSSMEVKYTSCRHN